MTFTKTPGFVSKQGRGQGRTGLLRLVRGGKPLCTLETPLLFPVVSMMTATTARGGGLWKYVLQENSDHGLLRRGKPLMTQALHFLDFGLSKTAVQTWRNQGLRTRYNEAFPELEYNAPLFLDSGGFKLLFNTQLDLTSYGLPMDDKQSERITLLQRDLGGDLIATLDYPLPPGLVRNEAQERMSKSRANAMKAAILVQNLSDYTPMLFVAVHGQNGSDIESYVSSVFHDMKRNGLEGFPFGVAIGSLVPLRGSRKHALIVELVKGAIRGIPQQYRATTPVHVFGVTGNLIPVLAYLGVDTFDSSTYVQQARSLTYFDPITHKGHAVLELDRFTCDCRICQTLDFDELHRSLATNIRYQPLPWSGHYKSKYYADIALHNLEMDYRIVEEVREAIENDNLVECLRAQSKNASAIRTAIEFLAEGDKDLRVFVERSVIAAPKLTLDSSQFSTEEPINTISLRYTPEAFWIDGDYKPPTGKRVLLVIPCSGDKPYSLSKSHRLISARLDELLGPSAAAIHKVTLSGLYGPVPQELENLEPILRYDFRLDPNNKSQIDLCAERLRQFILQHGDQYDALIAYATSLAYRTILERIASECDRFQLYPTKPKARRLTEFFRQSNISQVMEAIDDVFQTSSETSREDL